MPIDLRTQKLAQLAVKRCVNTKPGDVVIISGNESSILFMTELYKAVILTGAHPIVKFTLPGTSDFFYKYANKQQLEKFPDILMDTLKKANKYIGISSTSNTRELAKANNFKIIKRDKINKPIVDYICNNKKNIMKRCTIAYPCPALAQEAEMSINDYEKFVYEACLQNWDKIEKSMNKILKKFQKGKKVHLIGKNIDLKFEIKGEKAKSDLDGDNMPMGEIFMAPIKESVNGWVQFEYPSVEGGKEVTDIYLKFKNGKVIEFNSSKNKDFLEKMLNTDENAKYIGEFGIGCNLKIKKYTKNLLFDEKMSGTIHLALGIAYKENGGGNDSAIHWDLVKDMTKAKIVLDGKIIQENGNWKIRGVKL